MGLAGRTRAHNAAGDSSARCVSDHAQYCVVCLDCVPLKTNFVCVTSKVVSRKLCLSGQTVGWQQKGVVVSLNIHVGKFCISKYLRECLMHNI